ncbi:hypothetical protein, partial [Ruminococcus sp.]|uniref:hypothetical protein n=1 Tax=Ruminococcus sp. TaxID=41978 RepID=UPI0025F9E196
CEHQISAQRGMLIKNKNHVKEYSLQTLSHNSGLQFAVVAVRLRCILHLTVQIYLSPLIRMP